MGLALPIYFYHVKNEPSNSTTDLSGSIEPYLREGKRGE